MQQAGEELLEVDCHMYWYRLYYHHDENKLHTVNVYCQATSEYHHGDINFLPRSLTHKCVQAHAPNYSMIQG